MRHAYRGIQCSTCLTLFTLTPGTLLYDLYLKEVENSFPLYCGKCDKKTNHTVTNKEPNGPICHDCD